MVQDHGVVGKTAAGWNISYDNQCNDFVQNFVFEFFVALNYALGSFREGAVETCGFSSVCWNCEYDDVCFLHFGVDLGASPWTGHFLSTPLTLRAKHS